MKHLIRFLILSSVLLFTIACSDDDPIVEEFSCADEISNTPINQIQVMGSHNSYRQMPQDPIMFLINNSPELLPADFDPKSWDYTHVPLEEQFDNYNVRSIELDVYRDPTGGLFYVRKGNALVGLDPVSGEDALLQPGLKVMHFPDFDYLSHHLTFKDALEHVKQWSKNHPNHVPMTILVEAKEDSPDQMLPGFGLTETLAFDQQGVSEIEDEILSVFANDRNRIFTPDGLKGNYGTLNAAVLAKNWPTLDAMRGKIMFVLMGSDQVISNYVTNHSSLSGRQMFVFTEAGSPESAFLQIDDPVANYGEIKQRIAQGYMVRTRADADTYEARNGDYIRLMSAISSGAQVISTDYYRHDPRSMTDMGWTDYEAHLTNDAVAVLNDFSANAQLITCTISE